MPSAAYGPASTPKPFTGGERGNGLAPSGPAGGPVANQRASLNPLEGYAKGP